MADTDVEKVWMERRIPATYTTPLPLTLNDIEKPGNPIYTHPGNWERCEEKNPKVGGVGKVVTIHSGLEIETLDLNRYVSYSIPSLSICSI